MTILMDDDKNLLITRKKPIYRFETNVDEIKFVVPHVVNGYDMSKLLCVALLTMTRNGEEVGVFKNLYWNEEPYKENYFTASIPITRTLTEEPGEIKIWLMSVLTETNEEGVASISQFMETGYAFMNILNIDSTSEDVEKIWSHAAIDDLAKKVAETSAKLDEIAQDQTLEIENNNLVLKAGDMVLSSVELPNEIEWKEYD